MSFQKPHSHSVPAVVYEIPALAEQIGDRKPDGFHGFLSIPSFRCSYTVLGRLFSLATPTASPLDGRVFWRFLDGSCLHRKALPYPGTEFWAPIKSWPPLVFVIEASSTVLATPNQRLVRFGVYDSVLDGRAIVFGLCLIKLLLGHSGCWGFAFEHSVARKIDTTYVRIGKIPASQLRITLVCARHICAD